MASNVITNRDELEKMPHAELVEYAMSIDIKFRELESRISKLEGDHYLLTAEEGRRN